MGCSASVALDTKDISSRRESKEDVDDQFDKLDSSGSKYSNDLNDLRNSSVLTMQSGDLKINGKMMINTEDLSRKDYSNTWRPTMISSPFIKDSKHKILDSPAPFRKTANGVATTPQRLRLRRENPFPSPHAQRSNFPLQELEEDLTSKEKVEANETQNG